MYRLPLLMARHSGLEDVCRGHEPHWAIQYWCGGGSPSRSQYSSQWDLEAAHKSTHIARNLHFSKELLIHLDPLLPPRTLATSTVEPRALLGARLCVPASRVIPRQHGAPRRDQAAAQRPEGGECGGVDGGQAPCRRNACKERNHANRCASCPCSSACAAQARPAQVGLLLSRPPAPPAMWSSC